MSYLIVESVICGEQCSSRLFCQLMSSRFGYAAAGSVRVRVARPNLCDHW